ncbi:peptidase M3 [Polymorphobacter glacialis]|uniref:Peptidase M3 n=1 Tax=Sandarakinorhabdus glacialis TaxID=1614636 RepID=A0A916ZP12_9SPHN|nr:M3 family metallopeptidase [Polymorphobacter glacialis]GGE07151.1 peptidase M3 [Polymorphobacter glacialis]
MPDQETIILTNPLLAEWDGVWGAPRFDLFAADDFIPALTAAMALNRAEIEAIATNPAPADFDNSIAAMERAGAALAQVRRVFWMLASAQSTPDIRRIESAIGEMLTRHGTALGHDPRLFERVAAVCNGRDQAALDGEQLRLLENSYRGFIAGGAQLGGEAKARFAAIDERLQALSTAFGQNVLAAGAEWELWLDRADLDGLPDSLCASAAQRAAGAGQPGRFLFTLDRGDFENILGFSARRDMRETMWRAFTGRCDGGDRDNRPLIGEILALRRERAELLGFASFAHYKLDDSMAKTPAAAAALLERVWLKAHGRALDELAELQEFADAEGAAFELAAWDVRFYAEQVRRTRYALDGAAVRTHLTLEAVRAAAFGAAGRLYGLRFDRREDLAVYHPCVAAWAITNSDGTPAGLLFTDDIARAEKHGGAWMGSLRVQEKLDGRVQPVIYTVANFAAAPPGEATRLSLDEARTLFHEFGHAMHGLLSDVTYPSLAGTSVARDFVEFPSKFMEHWITAPEVLAGFGVPDALISAIGRAGTYGEGIATLEFLASAIVDLEIHVGQLGDWQSVEVAALERLGLPAAIAMRHRLPHFTHVFDGGYAAAYYSYLWSEVLDADAFEAFTEAGNIFDPVLAARFRSEILAQGDARDPALSFAAFRGRAPLEDALLRARGLA